MASTIRPSRTIAGLVAAGAAVAGLAVIASPASAATTTIKATGATITRSDATAGTTLTVKATVARLDLWCTAGKLVVNKKATTIPCNRLLSVTTTGLTGNDTVAINATGFGSSLPKTTLIVKTGAGNDTVSVRHRGSLTVYGGTGNDRLEAGLASGTHPVSEVLYGEDGNDSLENLGFITATPVTYDWNAIAPSKAVGSTLRGGPGADTLIGDDLRWTDVAVANVDKVDLHDGPGLITPDEGTGVAPAFTYQQATGSPNNPDTLTYGRATGLSIGCATVAGQPRARYVINGWNLPVACAYRYLTVQGTDRAEDLAYDQTLGNGFDRYGMGLTANLGGGDDTALVRHPQGSIDIHGGAGNDRLIAGIHNAVPNGEGNDFDTLSGDAGNDTLTNLGFLEPSPPTPIPGEPSYTYDYTTHLQGGPGADQVIGAPVMRNWYDVDVTDTLTDNGGLTWFMLTTTEGADSVAVHLRPNATSTVDATAGGKHASFTLSKQVVQITVDTLGGDDQIGLDGASLQGTTLLEPGAGNDYVRLAPLVAATGTLSDSYNWYRQPGYADIGVDTKETERFDLIQPH